MAHIFAIWTLKNMQFYKEMEGVDNRNSYLMTPHAGQIISILRILGIGYSEGGLNLKNNLVEIGTGEGKSVILAITSIILAMHGIDVYCSFYSE